MKTPPWKLRGSPRPTPGEPRSLIQTEKSGPATPALDPRLYRVSACHGREERELMRKLGVRGLSRRSRGHSERSSDAATKNSEEKQGMCGEQSRAEAGRSVSQGRPAGTHLRSVSTPVHVRGSQAGRMHVRTQRALVRFQASKLGKTSQKSLGRSKQNTTEEQAKFAEC